MDGYVAKLGHDWRAEVLEGLRAILASAAPGARELMRGGHPRYDDEGPVCYIRAREDRVEMGFWRGAEIPDPRGFLSGQAGQRTRQLVFTSPALVRERDRELKSLVHSAVRLNHMYGDPRKST